MLVPVTIWRRNWGISGVVTTETTPGKSALQCRLACLYCSACHKFKEEVADSMIQAKEDSYPQLIERIEGAIDGAQDWLLEQQASDGHWCAELEGDTILESEYLFYLHFIEKLDPVIVRKVANYVRSKALPEGGWSIYPMARWS